VPRRLAALLGIVVVVLATALPVHAAMDVAVSVSPAQGTVGHPVEVMVRTFAPVGMDDIALPAPFFAYPTPSGVWDVLYPTADYPFDVVASPANGDSVPVTMSRDPSDATLWRGSFLPTSSGDWMVTVRNFPALAPIRVSVTRSIETQFDGWVAVLALIVGVAVGLVLGRRNGRRDDPPPRPIG
jgi:hypothetical protein